MGDLSCFTLIDMPDMFGLSSVFILCYAYFLYSSHSYSSSFSLFLGKVLHQFRQPVCDLAFQIYICCVEFP